MERRVFTTVPRNIRTVFNARWWKSHLAVVVPLVAAGALFNPVTVAAISPAHSPLSFEKDIRPIFKAHCFHCHGEGEKLKGDLDLRQRRLALKGGEDGPAIVPGKKDASKLYTLLLKGEMPKGEKKLKPQEIELVGRWISQGAKTLRPEPEKIGPEINITEEERSFWAFQPVRNPPVPKTKKSDRVRNPIDAFLVARMKEKGLSFSPEADKRTLIRRAYFDLIGLPPTPEDVNRFLGDNSPDAYEKVIDQLLASPHYGEKWARHWLDVAGYADSDGYTDADPVRPYAYKYRDYVIKSFNTDKPFDQFIREQLAGDEMIPPPYKNLQPDDIEKLVATGFLRMAPDGTSGGADQNVARNQVMADTIKIVSTSLLGLTVGCAQCHNHRYDPIPQTDYYRLRAIFEPAYDWKNWRAPRSRLVSLYTDADVAKAKAIESEAVKIEQERKKKEEEFINITFDKELARLPEALREPIRIARNTPEAKRTAEQKKLLKENPSVNVSAGSLYLYDQKKADELKKIAEQAAAIRAKKPVEDYIQALTEIPGKIPTTYLFNRGDQDQPKQAVTPGDLTILATYHPKGIPEKDAALPTSGRRLAFANELTDGKHPLTARVLVNRIWLHHFGRGIVSTPGDFGFLGQRPTHPELLDWLATEFMTHGWQVKQLHKLIMTSTAYRQASVRDSRKDAKDPDNQYYWHMPVRRLEAEVLRDSILKLSGKLNEEYYGPPVPVKEDEVGQIVVGIEKKNGENVQTEEIPLYGQEYRRSVYIQVRRSRPLAVLDTFDAPSMDPNCEARNSSTVAPQSLMLMNSGFVFEQAKFFAERVRRESGNDLQAQAMRAWQMAFGGKPNKKELQEAMQFLAGQLNYYKANPPKAEPAAKGKKEKTPAAALTAEEVALATYCQALLSANAFLYVD